ncbi:MAG: hypothetical protein L6Q55_13000 [Azonexus sp.]|nr:hypothetical protein [Azonexus sp.]MCK6413322.1 hypothetical protein [Azonexus sp.]
MLQASGFLCAAQHYSRKAKHFRLKVDCRPCLCPKAHQIRQGEHGKLQKTHKQKTP